MMRYVVLRHEGVTDPHFDLMFESEPAGPLRTWRSPVWPIRERVRVVPLDLHRRAYLDYEGPVSGDRGYVTRVAAGTYDLRTPDAHTWEFVLHGCDKVEGLLFRTWQDTQGHVVWDCAGM
jgi:hypothetical protein